MKGLILITRPEEDAKSYKAELESKGFKALSAPMLEVVPEEFELPDLSAYQALLFTSANAVRLFSGAMDHRDLPVYVVGQNTEDEARKQGFSEIKCAHGASDALVARVQADVQDKTKPLLHVRGSHVAQPVDQMLGEKGFKVDTLVVYRAEPAETLPAACRQALKDGSIAAVTFFSARTAQNFMRLAQAEGLSSRLKTIKALSISTSVLECVQPHIWAGAYVAEKPDREGMLALLTRVCGDYSNQGREIMKSNDNQAIENAVEVIERFGGIRPLAKKINVAVTTVQGWKKRNTIPGSHRGEILEAAEQFNVDVSDILEDGEAANENQPSSVVSSKKPVLQAERPQKGPAAPPKAGQPDDLSKRLAETEKRAVTRSTVINTGLLVLALAAVVILLWPDNRPQQTGQQDLSALEGDVERIQGDIDAMKQEQTFLSGLIPQNLEERMENLQAQVQSAKDNVGGAVERAQDIQRDVLAENAGTLEQRVAMLEQHVSEIAGNPQLAALLERFKGLEDTIPGQDMLGQSVSELSALLAGFEGQPEQLNQALEQAKSQSTALSQTFDNVPSEDMKAAALLLGMSQFRSALNRDNEAFSDDLQLLKNLVGEENAELSASLDRLAPRAEQGVLTPGGLTDEFRELAGDVVVASLKGEDVSIKDKAQARLNELFQVEKDGELVTGTPTQATLVRAEQFLEEGNVEAAIAEVKTLEGPAAETAQPWLNQAEATLLAQQLKAMLTQSINTRAYGKAGGIIVDGVRPLGGSELIQDKESGISILKR